MKKSGWKLSCVAAGVAMAAGVAGAGEDVKTALIALNETDDGSFVMSGRVEVEVDYIHVNSAGLTALETNGTTEILGPEVFVVGGAEIGGDPYAGTLTEGADALENPLAGTPDPRANPNRDQGSIETLENGWEMGGPGYYSGGINVAKDSTLVLLPGIYVLDGVGLQLQGQASLIANGAVFCIIGSGSFSISGGASIVSSPPTSTAFRGVSIYQVASNTNTLSITGGGSINIGGAIYAPGATVSISGQTSISARGMAVGELIVADKIRLSGNGRIGFGDGSLRLPYYDRPPDWD